MNRVPIAAALALVVAGPALAQQASPAAPSVTRADFIAQMDAEFARFDGNRDGSVTREEIEIAQRQAAQAEALRQNRAVFDRLDGDRNGMLSPQEFAQLANPSAIPVDPAPMMEQFDSDKNGVVTLVEYRIVTQGNFDRTDGDRDGVVTPLEMRAAGIVQ